MGNWKMDYATLQRFATLCGRAGVTSERSRHVSDDLFGRYSEIHRTYHNLSHIDRMLSWFDASAQGTDDVELAIWFHDAIYEPLDSQNEAKSARYFRDCFGQFIEPQRVDDVERLIIATDPKRPRSGKNDENLLIDIDLSILGSTPADYEVYRLAVRSEYAVVSDADFTAGRRSILQRFLTGKIYATTYFAQLESQARSNIENELVNLE